METITDLLRVLENTHCHSSFFITNSQCPMSLFLVKNCILEWIKNLFIILNNILLLLLISITYSQRLKGLFLTESVSEICTNLFLSQSDIFTTIFLWFILKHPHWMFILHPILFDEYMYSCFLKNEIKNREIKEASYSYSLGVSNWISNSINLHIYIYVSFGDWNCLIC